MPIQTTQNKKGVAYFITFTCFQWLNLIQISNSYNAFYKWFDYLKTNNYPLLAYVIMPNHFHGIIFIPLNSTKNINTIIANAKRFIAYDIIKNLKEQNAINLLSKLEKAVTEKEKAKKQKHKVFKTSFDCKEILNMDMFFTKLDYIHRNPCKGKWNLANEYIDYRYSSAKYYFKNETDDYLTHFRDVL